MNKFTEECPLKLKEFPNKPCKLGKPELNKLNRATNEPGCPWWINCKKSSYCFWKYIYKNSDSDGYLPELLQTDLAKLFGCSTTKIHFMQKEAMENLTNILTSNEIEDSDVETETIQQSIDFDSLLDIDITNDDTDLK